MDESRERIIYMLCLTRGMALDQKSIRACIVLEKSLIKAIKFYVATTTNEYGVRKYRNASHFIRETLSKELRRENNDRPNN